jgi:hypothetical protein
MRRVKTDAGITSRLRVAYLFLRPTPYKAPHHDRLLISLSVMLHMLLPSTGLRQAIRHLRRICE